MRSSGRWHLFFNATIHLENEGEQQRAFSDALLRIKEESLKEKNRTWDPSDMTGLQELIKAKKRTGRPWKKEAAAAYFFQLRIKYKHYMEV